MDDIYFDEELRRFPGPEFNCSYYGTKCAGDLGCGRGFFCSIEEGYKLCGGPYKLDKELLLENKLLDLDERESIDFPQKL